ncbi:MAG: hypothetical protein M1832_000417 [Thelocarpon impressellum]|nr:MAG: hypothetical protein M1832_000417 [Thelocarpon impressellum]
MPPTETSILSDFLLTPSALPTTISLQKFTALFPRAQRSNPQIAAFYRELQHQRALVAEQVRRNIAAEAKRGERLRREVVKARRRAQREELGLSEGHDGREVDVETELFGPTSNLPTSRPHTLASIIPEMEAACVDVEAEIAAIEAEAEAILADITATVGDLSDLRYGRLNRQSGAADDDTPGKTVLDGLKRLEDVCDRTGLGG